MIGPVSLEQIDEFHVARRLPRTALDEKVVAGVRTLDERLHVEPFIRSILADFTNTPHGSSEIADILTTHVNLEGRSCHTAFVIKGKSTPKITSKNTGYQIMRLRQVPGLDLMILLAGGDIQDDIKRDLLFQAESVECDYMIVDTMDVARLFVAYHKVCPKDGFPFEQGRCPHCGTSSDQPIELRISLFDEPAYEVLRLEDVSHSGAKRYSANILVDEHYPRAALREVIKQAVWELRGGDYYRSAQVEAHFGPRDADVVFLYVYARQSDIQLGNWVCRALWISPDLPEKNRPTGWEGQDRLHGIVLDWNRDAATTRSLFEPETKQAWVKRVEGLLPDMQLVVEKTHSLLEARHAERMSGTEFERVMQDLEREASAISQRASGEKFAPLECHQADTQLQQLAAAFHNIFVPFAEWATGRRDWSFQEWHLRKYLTAYESDLRSLQHEWRKIR